VGRGTTIRILFPAIAEAQAEKNPAAGSQSAEAWAPAVRGPVLVVDDEDIIRDVCRTMVESLGMEVLTAADGREAVEVFRQNAGRISLVLLDLTMPNMDGIAAFREMVRIRPGVKVILSSGYNEQDFIRRLSGEGLAGFIQKPYSLDNLRDVLERAEKAGA
jgi:CheY-like chemotaxis protein